MKFPKVNRLSDDRSASSAYENIEWINKLVAYTANIAETKPHVKLIGEL